MEAAQVDDHFVEPELDVGGKEIPPPNAPAAQWPLDVCGLEKLAIDQMLGVVRVANQPGTVPPPMTNA